jgi:hypothetical protein
LWSDFLRSAAREAISLRAVGGAPGTATHDVGVVVGEVDDIAL